MKKFVSENWYKLMIGASFLMASSAFFINSISPAYGSDKNNFSENSINEFKSSFPPASEGKIMMDQNSFIFNNTYYYHVLVWDSETGKSKLFFHSSKSGAFSSAGYQLPSSPLD